MPPVSQHLNDLLTRWSVQDEDLRKEAVFQKDLIEPLALAASANRLAMRERFRRNVEQLNETADETWARWEERIGRLSDWKTRVGGLQQQAAQLKDLVHTSTWLEKAHRIHARFSARLEGRAERLHARQSALHERLQAWESALQEKDRSLQDVVRKQASAEHPFYVSRARKQPELDFTRAQRTVDETLGGDFQEVRESAKRGLGRIEKAYAALDRRVAGAQILYHAPKQDILAALKRAEDILKEERERILLDGLLYESCRSAARKIETIVEGLRCIEDMPPPKSGWFTRR